MYTHFPSPAVYFVRALIKLQWNPQATKLHGIQLYGTPVQPLLSCPLCLFLLPLITWLYGTVGGNVAIPLLFTPVSEAKEQSDRSLGERKLKERQEKGPAAGQERGRAFEWHAGNGKAHGNSWNIYIYIYIYIWDGFDKWLLNGIMSFLTDEGWWLICFNDGWKWALMWKMWWSYLNL